MDVPRYRSKGVQVSGADVYSQDRREKWSEMLPPSCLSPMAVLYSQYDALVPIKEQTQKDMIAEARRHRIYRVLTTCPGLGPVRVSQSMAVIVTPHRFRTKRQLWRYRGYGVKLNVSSEWEREHGVWVKVKKPQTRGLDKRSNHVLKACFDGAATTVITQLRSSPLGRNYDRMLEEGIQPDMAKLTTARKIAAIYLAMWKNEKEYDPQYCTSS